MSALLPGMAFSGAKALDAPTYLRVRAAVWARGHRGDWEWAEGVRAPESPEAFACEYVWVVLNSGMKNTVARKIMDRLWPAVRAGEPAAARFGHAGKCAAIDEVWRRRVELLAAFHAAADKLAWCESLPWIGGITKYHLAKNLGVDCAKPDRWLVRLADVTGETIEGLCVRLAAATGERVATVDVVLWRACAIGVLRVANGAIRFGGAP